MTDSRGICPSGWHVPTEIEWRTLVSYLGGFTYSGGRMKESGTAHWDEPNTDAIDDCGFVALPGGYRYRSGDFYSLGWGTSFWSSVGTSEDYAWYYELEEESGYLDESDEDRKYGYSVRCIKD